MNKSDPLDAPAARAAPSEPRRSMNKSNLIDALAARADLPKARAELVVNCVFDAMTEALAKGQSIEIRGFGSFTAQAYDPYVGRNPRNSDPVNVAPKRLPRFKVGKELRELVDASRRFVPFGSFFRPQKEKAKTPP